MTAFHQFFPTKIQRSHTTHTLGVRWILPLTIITLLCLLITGGIATGAPLKPVNKVIKTVCSSGCNYKTIKAAIDASSAGWTIQVKNGTYNEMIYTTKKCTETNPCALMAYPGHSPKIDGTGKNANGIFLRGSWWIIDGFEITKAKYDGFKVDKPHNTFRNNHVHHNKVSGIKVQLASDILIEDNISEYNGTDPGTCINGGVSSPRHCHAVYIMGRGACNGITKVTIRRNTLRNQGGAGIQINNQGCGGSGQEVRDFLWENNVIQNCAVGFQLFHNNKNGIIRNNTVVLNSTPPTNEKIFTFFTMTGAVTGHKVYNNIFYTKRSDVRGLTSLSAGQYANKFDYNLWKVGSNIWTWLGKARSDFKTSYRNITGWDANSECCEVDPKFISVANGDYGITYYSFARNTGINSLCAAHDKDGFPRPEEAVCDMGMYEYVP